MIHTKQRDKHTYEVYYSGSNKYLGEAVRLQDGDFLFFPVKKSGGWSNYALQEIANLINNLNNYK